MKTTTYSKKENPFNSSGFVIGAPDGEIDFGDLTDDDLSLGNEDGWPTLRRLRASGGMYYEPISLLVKRRANFDE
ncbi:hypothetical protein [Bordetella genomosp. 9]|uniref:hypothetical protein n=1 Tax=Bordetella genomosp. 9 TaxID=1416803 RepID=UPI0012F91E60|nr:hypothetical protein [Bordetella genomosp. 9]